MLNVRNITFAYFAVLWILFNFSSLHYSFYIIASVIYFIIPVTASLSICSNLYLKVICNWKTEKDEVVLSFNLSEKTDMIDKVLEILKNHNVQTLMFCTGELLQDIPDLTDKMKESGNAIGNLSWSVSRKFGFLYPKNLINELARTEELISNTDEESIKYFRPPYGVTNPSVKKATQIMSYVVIGWNWWVKPNNINSNQNIDRQISRMKKGSIIRIDITNDLDISNLDKFISSLAKRFSIVDMDEIINQINVKK